MWYNYHNMDETTRYRAYLCCGPRCTANRSTGLVDVLAEEQAAGAVTTREEAVALVREQVRQDG